MIKEQIYACKELGVAEKYLFLWFNDYQKKHEVELINIGQVEISKAIATERRNTQRAIKSLIKKGFLKEINYKSSLKSNSYKILK